MGLREWWYKHGWGKSKQAQHVTHFKGTPTSEPATPEPRYVCQNCGMLIETGHKHTREECKTYKESPITPDMRLRKTMLEKYPGRNDPKIRLPYYYDSSISTKNEEKE